MSSNSGPAWICEELRKYLQNISEHFAGAATIFYASAFLQRPQVDVTAIAIEDINGFMNALSGGVESDNGLVLVLHTPGGDINAVETIVEYLHSKFDFMSVIVPCLAMSGGAMISLASDKLVLGRQSQLGPIDPQISFYGQRHSARAIKEGFNEAKKDISTDIRLAHLWAPILQNMGPSLVLQAEKSLAYSEDLVVKWLKKRMLRDENGKSEKAKTIASFFNAENISQEDDQIHVHGQRIGRDKLKELGLNLNFLEEDQDLQDVVLTAYHLMTLLFEHTNNVKFISNHIGKMWLKPYGEPIPE